ncbi:BspA family leucine-rich repeat surface protein [Catenovulum agarivorans]|nr:BspA family leucine-rich repeat surface protein [Catenovulum agarivorans]
MPHSTKNTLLNYAFICLFTLLCWLNNIAIAHPANVADSEQSNFRPFISKWKIEQANTTITLPTWGDGYDYKVDWGDGTVEHWQDAPIKAGDKNAKHLATHLYTQPGIYRIKIWGKFPQIHFDNGIRNGDAPGVDKDKIIDIEQWGDIQWRSMGAAFWGCKHLNVSASDAPILSKVSKTNGMFRDAISFNGDISHWNVSQVKNLSNMFNGASAFDQNLGDWQLDSAKGLNAFLSGVALSPENYDALLISWSKQKKLRKRVKFDAGKSQYTQAGAIAKQKLIEKLRWQFIDGGLVEN